GTPIQATEESNSPVNNGVTAQKDFLATIPWDAEYDVVVLGYGFAGSAASIAAADKGAKVLLSEKAPQGKEGGNSKYAAQHVLSIDPKYSDEEALKYLQRLRGENPTPSDKTLLAFIHGAKKQVDYMKFLGVENPPEYPSVEYPEYEGAEAYRSTGVKLPGGDGALYALMQKNIQQRGNNIDVWYNSPGKKLIQDPETGIIHGVIIEVEGQPKYVRAKNGVVLATGGYENNPDMFRDFARTQKAYSKGARYNTGEGVLMAMDVKANMVNMANNNGPDPNVLNPETGISYGYMVTGEKDSDWSGPAFTRHNVIMVGPDGKRFFNEAKKTRHGRVPFHGDYNYLQMPDPAYMIFDENARKASRIYGSWSDGNLAEIEKGIVKKADTLEELAKLMNIDVEGLVDQVKRYNQYCKDGKDQEFDRSPKLLKPLTTAPFYAVEVVPTYTNTQGGPERDETAAILDRQGKRIPHLYGAGELGSVFSNKYNGSGNIGESLIFGRIAGAEAANTKSDVDQRSVLNGKPGFNQVTLQQEYVLEPGEKLGIGQGIGGQIVLAVKSDNGKIVSVRILKQEETPGVGSKALEILPTEAVQSNGNVDNYTGASVTSQGFKEALADALK
ncbi:MAG: FAD-binding protein, partial [Burkholderiales bacterium]|nr:FAD-binding protein [Burkholderiales bacterium]